MTVITTKLIETPVGKMIAGVANDAVCLLDFPWRTSFSTIAGRLEAHFGAKLTAGEHPLLDELEGQLQAYFTGERQSFDLPLSLAGSAFQQSVWEALRQVPFGETANYLQQAKSLGNPDAIRAVAKANGENALMILIPCHRIIGSDGGLTGYAGGLQAKQWLLDHERKVVGKAVQSTLW